MRIQRVVLATERHDHRIGAVARRVRRAGRSAGRRRPRSGRIRTGTECLLRCGRLPPPRCRMVCTDDLVAEQHLRAAGLGIDGKCTSHLRSSRRSMSTASAARQSPRTCGSSSRSSSGPMIRTPGTPLATARSPDVVQPRAAPPRRVRRAPCRRRSGGCRVARRTLRAGRRRGGTAGLVGTRLVIQARVHDAAVAARLVRREPVFLLEERHVGVGVALRGSRGRPHADDAATDDRDPVDRRRPPSSLGNWGGSPPLVIAGRRFQVSPSRSQVLIDLQLSA